MRASFCDAPGLDRGRNRLSLWVVSVELCDFTRIVAQNVISLDAHLGSEVTARFCELGRQDNPLADALSP